MDACWVLRTELRECGTEVPDKVSPSVWVSVPTDLLNESIEAATDSATYVVEAKKSWKSGC